MKLFHNHCSDNQKFVINDDTTLSPIVFRDAVWGVQDDELILVGKRDEGADRLSFSPAFVAAVREAGTASTPRVHPAQATEHVLELASHPGLALSAVPAEPTRLILVPIAEAEPFLVAQNRLQLVNGGARIAVGPPR